MNYSIRRHDAKLSAILLAPLERVEQAPIWVRFVSLGAAAYQYVTTSAFTVALFLVVIAATFDYILGVKAARFAGTFTPKAAHAGLTGKWAGLGIAMFIRIFEYFILVMGLGDTKGMVATAVAISLFASDLQSIAHHRERFGAKPIPVLSAALEWMQRFAASKVPSPPAVPAPATPQRRKDDGEGWEG